MDGDSLTLRVIFVTINLLNNFVHIKFYELSCWILSYYLKDYAHQILDKFDLCSYFIVDIYFYFTIISRLKFNSFDKVSNIFWILWNL